MTSNPHWHEQTVAFQPDPAMPEASADRLEPPALQTNKSDRPEEPMSHPENGRNGDSGARGVEDMLQQICDKIDENERRYGSALDELHERLDHMSGDAPQEQPDEVAVQQPISEVPAMSPQPEPALAPAEEAVDAAAPQEEPQAGQQDTFEEIERRVMEFAEGTRSPTAVPGQPMDFDSRFRDISAELEDSLATTPEPAEPEFVEPADEPEPLAAAPQAETFQPSPEAPQVFASPIDQVQPEPQPIAEPSPMNAPPSEGLHSIETTLSNLTSYFERAESQFGRMDSIEDHLNRLAETMQAAVPQVEQAARQAAQEVLSSYAQEGGMSDAMRRLDAIEASLRAINERSEQMDSRTVDALTSMNHTINALTDQLSGDRPVAAANVAPSPIVAEAADPYPDPAPAAHAVQPAPQPHLGDVLPEPAVDPMGDASYEPAPAPVDDGFAEVRITRAAEDAPQPQQDVSGLGAELPDYQPMSGVPNAQATAQPQAPGVQQPAAQAPYGEAPLNDANDFLAAARRAAQAAAFQPEETPKSESFFSRFRRKPKEPKADPLPEGRKPKPVLVFAALLLLVVSAVLLYGRLMNKPGGSVTGFFERNSVPTTNSAGKSKAKLSLDPQSDQNRANAVQPSLTPVLPMQERERFVPRKGGQDRVVTPKTPQTSPYILKAPTSKDASVQHAPTLSVAPSQRAGLPEGVQAQPASMTPRVVQQPETAPIVRSTPHRQADEKPRTIALPPAAIGPMSLRSAAAKGDAKAQFEVANRYAKGHGVSRDYEKAWRWYHYSASKSFAPAQYMLAALYERGLGTDRDLEQAKAWYRRAAGLGNVKAMHNLAVMHTGRDGKPANYDKAGKWFAKAADFGLADSQFNLGILYENGLGVTKSSSEAYKWFALAANRGDTEAGKRRDLVKLKMEPAVLAKAKRTVSNWRAAPINKAANRIPNKKAAWAPPGPGPADVGAPKFSPNVAKAQKLLNKLGYTAGPADGKMGPKTQSAIKDFQMRSGLEATGSVNDELISHLEALTG